MDVSACALCALPLSEHAEHFGIADGSVNNCARRHGDPPERCPMCRGACWPSHRFTPPKIASFDGEYRFLSNFYPCTVVLYGRVFASSEHAFQAAKCAHASDYERFQVGGMTAGEAKRLGRAVTLRADWEQVKVQAMRAVVYDKFTRNPRLAVRLRATGSAVLEEGNTWGDVFWGLCNGQGENWLGRILMDVRATLAAAPARDDEIPF